MLKRNMILCYSETAKLHSLSSNPWQSSSVTVANALQAMSSTYILNCFHFTLQGRYDILILGKTFNWQENRLGDNVPWLQLNESTE